MLVESRLDDVLLTQAFTGLDANMLRPSIIAAGLDPKALEGRVSPERAHELFSMQGKELEGPKRWVDLWSAGHSVSGIDKVQSVIGLIDELTDEYERAQQQTAMLIR